MLQVFSELDGKDINEVISEGMGKLASMPSGNATLQSSYISGTVFTRRVFMFNLYSLCVSSN